MQVIITQLFYDVEVFLQFARDVRAMGITAPILPGIMILNAYGGFQRMTGFCKTRVPESVAKRVEELKEDAEGTKAYGIELGTSICRTLLASGLVQGTSNRKQHTLFPHAEMHSLKAAVVLVRAHASGACLTAPA